MHEQKIDFQIQTTDGCSFVHSWQLFLPHNTDEKISHEQKIDFQIQTTDGCSFVHSWQLFLPHNTDEKISHECTNKKLISKYKQPSAVHSCIRGNFFFSPQYG